MFARTSASDVGFSVPASEYAGCAQPGFRQRSDTVDLAFTPQTSSRCTAQCGPTSIKPGMHPRHSCLLFLWALVACSASERPKRADSVPRSSVGLVQPLRRTAQLPESTAARFDAAGHPVLPVILSNYCQGEDCTVRFSGVACLPVQLRPVPTDTVPPVHSLAAGSSFTVEQRALVVPHVGVVVVRRDFVLDWETDAETGVALPRPDTVRFARGDTLFVLAYADLGGWMWAYRSMVHFSAQFWASAADQSLGGRTNDSSRAVAVTAPRSEDWWFVRTASDTAGWWRADERGSLQSVAEMRRWSESCVQIRARADSTLHDLIGRDGAS